MSTAVLSSRPPLQASYERAVRGMVLLLFLSSGVAALIYQTARRMSWPNTELFSRDEFMLPSL